MSHSLIKRRWLEEAKYLLENYIGEELGDYSDTDFDVQVVRMIRRLKAGSRFRVFGGEKKMFVIKERLESGKVECGDEVAFFEKKSTLQTYLSQIIQKCGGEMTSRVEEADIMIALDRTNDYDENNEVHLKRIEMDQKHFVVCIEKLKRLVTKAKVEVISSEWVLDCILEDRVLHKDDYSLVSLGSD
jgi:hypothetical protein